MKFTPIGTCDMDAMVSAINPSDFDSSTFRTVALGTDKSKGLVLLMQSRMAKPYPWRVIHGTSQIVFRSYEDALDFCNTRGIVLSKGK